MKYSFCMLIFKPCAKLSTQQFKFNANGEIKPLIPKSDELLISLFSITVDPNVKDQRSPWFLNKFSLLLWDRVYVYVEYVENRMENEHTDVRV